MDDVAEREPSYWLWSYGPGDDAFKAAVTIDMTKPTDQVRRGGGRGSGGGGR